MTCDSTLSTLSAIRNHATDLCSEIEDLSSSITNTDLNSLESAAAIIADTEALLMTTEELRSSIRQLSAINLALVQRSLGSTIKELSTEAGHPPEGRIFKP